MSVGSSLQDLLEVQEHDTRLDQLRHQRDTLPERVAHQQARTRLEATDAELAAAAELRADLVRRQEALDDEVSSLEAKRAKFDGRLYDGTVTNPRELQDLQEEIAALGRRITTLEDREIEIMEQSEPLEGRLGELSGARTAQAAEVVAAHEALVAVETELVTEIEREATARDRAAAAVPEDLLGRYDKLRAGLGGVAVARLVGNQCGGCHLTLSAMESARLRRAAADEMNWCEECGRILVP